MQLGFVGLGDQGAPIVHRLLDAGHPVMLWARRPQSLTPFQNSPATVAPDLKTLAQSCDWIGICVFDDAGVFEVCRDIMPQMRRGASIVVHSTVHPDTCRTIAQDADALGLLFVDGPVSGGRAAAVAGTLTIMVGASPEAFTRSEPVFACYGSLIRRLGPVGAGQCAKLVNNTLLSADMALGSAALAAVEQFGIDRDAMVEIVNASSGRSFGFSVIAQLGSAGLPPHAAKLLSKDVDLFASCLPDDQAISPFVRLTSAFLADPARG